MSSIAIITARGGSKRIPGKNKKLFLGKPIIQYSIEAALVAGIFDEVMVSTDDEEIAMLSRKAGATVPFMRSEKTSNDYATTDDVLIEVLDEYRKLGKRFDYMACLYPTAPFITAKKLQMAMEKMKNIGAVAIMPVVAFSFPPQRGMIEKDGRLAYCYPENAIKRSQDLETIYHDCGQFYCYDVKQYLDKKGKVDADYAAIVVPETEVQDIDCLSDWEIAEMKYSIMLKKEADTQR